MASIRENRGTLIVTTLGTELKRVGDAVNNDARSSRAIELFTKCAMLDTSKLFEGDADRLYDAAELACMRVEHSNASRTTGKLRVALHKMRNFAVMLRAALQIYELHNALIQNPTYELPLIAKEALENPMLQNALDEPVLVAENVTESLRTRLRMISKSPKDQDFDEDDLIDSVERALDMIDLLPNAYGYKEIINRLQRNMGLVKRAARQREMSIVHPWMKKTLEEAQSCINGLHLAIRTENLWDQIESEFSSRLEEDNDKWSDAIGRTALRRTVMPSLKALLRKEVAIFIPDDGDDEFEDDDQDYLD